MPGDINDVPVVDVESCNGCGICISRCPGLAIFVVDKTYSEDMALVKLPYEYLPLPAVGQFVEGTDRRGEILGSYEIIKVTSGGKKNLTYTVSIAVPQSLAMEVRGFQVKTAGQ